MIFEDNFAFLRTLIKRFKTKQATHTEQEFFKKIFRIWCFNEISLFSLCVISGNYRLADKIIRDVSVSEMKEVDTIQLTQFVKMLELPYFSYVRIELIDTDINQHLYRSLQSVLMIIPQGKTFDLLKNRLNCVAFFSHMNDSKQKEELGVSEEEKELWKLYE